MKKEKSQLTDRITIPPEALKAASTVIFEMREDGDFSAADIARAAAEALLAAWPGVTTTSWFENSVRKAVLNITLPQDASDE